MNNVKRHTELSPVCRFWFYQVKAQQSRALLVLCHLTPGTRHLLIIVTRLVLTLRVLALGGDLVVASLRFALDDRARCV